MPDESANRRLKIEAHDASRVEWSIYIPLPRGSCVSEAEVSLRRLYRVPLTLVVETPAGSERREAVIVLNRRGIARIVAEGAAPSVPAEVELELENGGPELVPQP
jgi:hypothetical protein